MSARSRHDRRVAARYARTRPHRSAPIALDEIEAFQRLTVSQLDVLVSSFFAERPLVPVTGRRRQVWAGFAADDLAAPVAVMWMMAAAGVPLALPPLWRLRPPGLPPAEEV